MIEVTKTKSGYTVTTRSSKAKDKEVLNSTGGQLFSNWIGTVTNLKAAMKEWGTNRIEYLDKTKANFPVKRTITLPEKNEVNEENKYKVPQKLWKGFGSDKARRVFNNFMDQAIPNQSITVGGKIMPPDRWNTLCWNMACFAAWAVRDEKPTAKIVDITQKKKSKLKAAK